MTEIFVFGSNLKGRHGKGAALYARKNYGAIYGQGVGRQGNSYAIPTKDGQLHPLTLSVIRQYIEEFKNYAKGNQHLTFILTPIGCGLAGYAREQIRPMFDGMTSNVIFHSEWSK